MQRQMSVLPRLSGNNFMNLCSQDIERDVLPLRGTPTTHLEGPNLEEAEVLERPCIDTWKLQALSRRNETLIFSVDEEWELVAWAGPSFPRVYYCWGIALKYATVLADEIQVPENGFDFYVGRYNIRIWARRLRSPNHMRRRRRRGGEFEPVGNSESISAFLEYKRQDGAVWSVYDRIDVKAYRDFTMLLGIIELYLCLV